MPLYLRPPRKGKTPYYEVRGSYLGITVERSTRTSDPRLAGQIKRRYMRAIERGEFERTEIAASEPTFLMATVAYLKAGGDARFLGPIIEMTGEYALRDRKLDDIDQLLLDNAAAALYPDATPQTRNRQFYTPVSSVLKRAGREQKIHRPKGWRGKKSKSSLEPAQAFALCFEAEALDAEFGALCWTLLYTGMRISEPLAAELGHLNLERHTLYIPHTKNGDPRTQHLPPFVVAKFKALPPRQARPSKGRRGQPGRSQVGAGVPFLERDPRSKLFRFHQGGYLRKLLATAMTNAGLSFPRRQRGFHLFCHTYGTWMTHFAGLDNYGLTRTRRWKDPRSAEGYIHTKVNAEALLADTLPTPPIARPVQPETKRARRSAPRNGRCTAG